MTSIPFDTLKVVARLEQAGMPAEQARVQAAVLAEVIAAEALRSVERHAGKADVGLELVGLRAELKTIDAKVDKAAAEVKSELVRWVVSVGVLQMALITGLVLKLAN
ncbi:MAG: hypothetical protein JO171_09115 [Paludibacterium sp.]|uniref:hypothetical protein n=1 Tax=Paludibacterium sp. TaxID=1917523 RepID=UPI0025F79054|nr:hypothetical protein [Paludibacterium sp.]MBV8047300.1 hypothetical protein [Paludibacterium sp.]MBV8647768.1 hypothetical protein [Paludibacterium sp.]